MRAYGAALLLAVALPAQVCFAQTFQGFLHYRWGTSWERMHDSLDLRLLSTHDGTMQYATGIRFLEHVPLASCDFEFNHGRFSGVFLTTRGSENSHGAFEFLRRMFGPCATDDTLGCLWISGDTSVAYDEDSAGDATIYWYCISMQP